MLQRMGTCAFHDQFHRDNYGGYDSYTYEALEKIYEVMEEENEDYEFDYYDIKARFTEYDSLEDFMNEEEDWEGATYYDVLDLNNRKTGRILVDESW